MTWLRAHWPRVLGIGNGIVFLALAGIAIWILTRPQTTPDRPVASPNPSLNAGAPAPVFTVAPPYGSAPAITGAHALLTGHVVDSASGAALAGAQLDFKQAGGPLVVHTDARGSFQAVIDTTQPFGFTITAPDHSGGASFGRLCPGDTRDVTIPVGPAGSPPTAPTAIQGSAC